MNHKQQSDRSAARRICIVAAGIVLAAMTTATPASVDASTFRVPRMSELTGMSSAVVRGTVTSSESRRIADSGRIVTDYSIKIIEVIAESKDSNIGGAVRITFPGGAIGDDGELVAGVPTYSTGDEVVLFLKRPNAASATFADREFYLVTGMAVGAFKVDRAVVERPVARGYVYREPSGAQIQRSSAAALKSSATSEPDSVGLRDLIDAVRSTAAKSSVFKGAK